VNLIRLAPSRVPLPIPCRLSRHLMDQRWPSSPASTERGPSSSSPESTRGADPAYPARKRQRMGSTAEIAISRMPEEFSRGKIFDDFCNSLDGYHLEVAARSSTDFPRIPWDADGETVLRQRLIDGLPKDNSWQLYIGWKPSEVIVLVTRLSRRDWDPSHVSKTAFTILRDWAEGRRTDDIMEILFGEFEVVSSNNHRTSKCYADSWISRSIP
jgi:hypothetical protein